MIENIMVIAICIYLGLTNVHPELERPRSVSVQTEEDIIVEAIQSTTNQILCQLQIDDKVKEVTLRRVASEMNKLQRKILRKGHIFVLFLRKPLFRMSTEVTEYFPFTSSLNFSDPLLHCSGPIRI